MKEGSYISIGDVNCDIFFWNSTSVLCEIDSTPAGTFTIEFVIGDRGLVRVSESLTVQLGITAVTPAIGSVAGTTDRDFWE